MGWHGHGAQGIAVHANQHFIILHGVVIAVCVRSIVCRWACGCWDKPHSPCSTSQSRGSRSRQPVRQQLRFEASWYQVQFMGEEGWKRAICPGQPVLVTNSPLHAPPICMHQK